MNAVVDVVDRSMCVRPDQNVRTAWININVCELGNRSRMSPEAVEAKYRRLLCMGDDAPWPPIVGHWEQDKFIVMDGRHEFVASLMLGRTRLLVCWVERA